MRIKTLLSIGNWDGTRLCVQKYESAPSGWHYHYYGVEDLRGLMIGRYFITWRLGARKGRQGHF